MTSAELNAGLGVEKQILPGIRSVLRRKLPSVFSREHPGADAVPSRAKRYRRNYGLKRIRKIKAADVYRGRWYKKDQELPAADRILTLEGFRDADADGMHPSAFVVDPKTGLKYKLKFTGKGDELHDSAATTTRLLDTMGNFTDPIEHYAGSDDDDTSGVLVTPEVVYAAHKYQNRLGARVPRIARRMGAAPGEVGPAVHPVWDQVAAVGVVKNGRTTVKRGDEAREMVRAARTNLRVRGQILYVRLKNVNLLDKNDSWSSIGPWNPSAPQHAGNREVRALSIIMDSWLGGNDVRVPNLRTDARKKKGQIQVVHKVSDTGSTLRTGNPNSLGWEIDVKRNRGVNHEDNGTIIHDEFDRTTANDAAWATIFAAMTRDQITAAVVAGANSAPIASLYIEKIISRRNSALAEYGKLIGVDKKGRKKYKLVGHKGTFKEMVVDRHISAEGSATFVFGKGAARVTVDLPAGRHTIRPKLLSKPVEVNPVVDRGVLRFRRVSDGKIIDM